MIWDWKMELIKQKMHWIGRIRHWIMRKGFKTFEEKKEKYKSGFWGWWYRNAKSGMLVSGVLFGILSFLFWIRF